MESIFYFRFTTCKHLQKAKTVEIEYLLQTFVAVFLSQFRIKLRFVTIQFLVFFEQMQFKVNALESYLFWALSTCLHFVS